MAIVKGPALSIDASGNLGPICFAKWRGFQIARAAKSSEPSHTPLQEEQWGRAVTAAQAWSGVLTDPERASWRAAAADQVRLSRVNTKYVPSGYHYFLGLTIQLLRQGLPIAPLPPIAQPPFIFMYIEALQLVGQLRLRTYFKDRTPDSSTHIKGEDWMAGPYTSGGYHPQPYDYKFQEFRSVTSGNLYSDLIPDTYYWFKMRWIDDTGRVGNWFETVVFISAI